MQMLLRTTLFLCQMLLHPGKHAGRRCRCSPWCILVCRGLDGDTWLQNHPSVWYQPRRLTTNGPLLLFSSFLSWYHIPCMLKINVQGATKDAGKKQSKQNKHLGLLSSRKKIISLIVPRHCDWQCNKGTAVSVVSSSLLNSLQKVGIIPEMILWECYLPVFSVAHNEGIVSASHRALSALVLTKLCLGGKSYSSSPWVWRLSVLDSSYKTAHLHLQLRRSQNEVLFT